MAIKSVASLMTYIAVSRCLDIAVFVSHDRGVPIASVATKRTAAGRSAATCIAEA